MRRRDWEWRAAARSFELVDHWQAACRRQPVHRDVGETCVFPFPIRAAPEQMGVGGNASIRSVRDDARTCRLRSCHDARAGGRHNLTICGSPRACRCPLGIGANGPRSIGGRLIWLRRRWLFAAGREGSGLSWCRRVERSGAWTQARMADDPALFPVFVSAVRDNPFSFT